MSASLRADLDLILSISDMRPRPTVIRQRILERSLMVMSINDRSRVVERGEGLGGSTRPKIGSGILVSFLVDVLVVMVLSIGGGWGCVKGFIEGGESDMK